MLTPFHFGHHKMRFLLLLVISPIVNAAITLREPPLAKRSDRDIPDIDLQYRRGSRARRIRDKSIDQGTSLYLPDASAESQRNAIPPGMLMIGGNRPRVQDPIEGIDCVEAAACAAVVGYAAREAYRAFQSRRHKPDRSNKAESTYSKPVEDDCSDDDSFASFSHQTSFYDQDDESYATAIDHFGSLSVQDHGDSISSHESPSRSVEWSTSGNEQALTPPEVQSLPRYNLRSTSRTTESISTYAEEATRSSGRRRSSRNC